jgi:peptidyl-prolyl cis-trans isomerase D
MFDFVRKHTKIMMVLMFLLIIPSFVLFGIDGYNRMGDSNVAVARVAGVDITQAQWDRAHKARPIACGLRCPMLTPSCWIRQRLVMRPWSAWFVIR